MNTEPKKWKDEPEYRQLTATITNGRRTIDFVADDKKGRALPEIQPFTRIKVEVEYANTDKGNTSVRGRIVNE